MHKKEPIAINICQHSDLEAAKLPKGNVDSNAKNENFSLLVISNYNLLYGGFSQIQSHM